jgi:hypothetical protein
MAYDALVGGNEHSLARCALAQLSLRPAITLVLPDLLGNGVRFGGQPACHQLHS